MGILEVLRSRIGWARMVHPTHYGDVCIIIAEQFKKLGNQWPGKTQAQLFMDIIDQGDCRLVKFMMKKPKFAPDKDTWDVLRKLVKKNHYNFVGDFIYKHSIALRQIGGRPKFLQDLVLDGETRFVRELIGELKIDCKKMSGWNQFLISLPIGDDNFVVWCARNGQIALTADVGEVLNKLVDAGYYEAAITWMSHHSSELPKWTWVPGLLTKIGRRYGHRCIETLIPIQIDPLGNIQLKVPDKVRPTRKPPIPRR